MTQSDRIESKLDRLLELLETEEKKEKVDWKAKAEMGVIKYLQRKSRKLKKP